MATKKAASNETAHVIPSQMSFYFDLLGFIASLFFLLLSYRGAV